MAASELLILDYANNLLKSQTNKSEESSTIFVVGQKAAGKSTLIYNFLDKRETPKETLVLEYSFGRKTIQKQNGEKCICHLWEYGGNLTMMKNALNIIPSGHRFMYCIMIDLSKIKEMWTVLEHCLMIFDEYRNSQTSKPAIIIIGGKYDIFKNFDTDVKKTVYTTLRSLALLFKTGLFFYSAKEAGIARNVKDILIQFGFRSGTITKDKVCSLSKPIYLPNGVDSWELLGSVPLTLDQIKNRHLASIPLQLDRDVVISDPGKWGPPSNVSFPEPLLDALVSMKHQEFREKSFSSI